MPGWKAIEQAEPDFAGRVRRLFDAGRHKTYEGSSGPSAVAGHVAHHLRHRTWPERITREESAPSSASEGMPA
jgi:hypothetical protein